ncbi:DUF364 domain-containing protein [Clostridium sp. Ade.TY]|uniref:Rossmann-like domain-containing protein n=1 Tax=Clostridium sp. Ade.TY TaxID=1391647 RepID=UPI00041C2BD8|nr:DUF364 domain-containing protein [Clostridium sp. Ade.TY]
MNFYNDIRENFIKIIEENNLDINEEVILTKKLTPKEAIGNPDRDDYPILKGKEVLLNSNYKGFIGQAYTDNPKDFKGTLEDILNLDLNVEDNLPVFIATLNAVLRSLNLIDNTIHCKDDEPKECAKKILMEMKKSYKGKNIALIGLQPGILNALSKEFNVRVLDLNDENIGKEKSNVIIEHGINDFSKVVNWADILLVTGSTSCNGTITNFLNIKKPIYFYGTSISGIAYIMGLNRLCFCSK